MCRTEQNQLDLSPLRQGLAAVSSPLPSLRPSTPWPPAPMWADLAHPSPSPHTSLCFLTSASPCAVWSTYSSCSSSLMRRVIKDYLRGKRSVKEARSNREATLQGQRRMEQLPHPRFWGRIPVHCHGPSESSASVIKMKNWGTIVNMCNHLFCFYVVLIS